MVRYHEIIQPVVEDELILSEIEIKELLKSVYLQRKYKITRYDPVTKEVDIANNLNLGKKAVTLPFTVNFVDGVYGCSNLKLTNFINAPKSVSHMVNCDRNRLQSLKGCPQGATQLNCYDNLLTNFEYCPTTVTNLMAHRNQINTLEHVPPSVQYLSVDKNNLTSFKGLPSSCKSINATDNPISSLNGLEKCNNLENINITLRENMSILKLAIANKRVLFQINGDDQPGTETIQEIFNSNIKKYPSELKRRILEVQYALIKAGYKEHAKW